MLLDLDGSQAVEFAEDDVADTADLACPVRGYCSGRLEVQVGVRDGEPLVLRVRDGELGFQRSVLRAWRRLRVEWALGDGPRGGTGVAVGALRSRARAGDRSVAGTSRRHRSASGARSAWIVVRICRARVVLTGRVSPVRDRTRRRGGST
ncbi:hypothetical protein ACWGE0_26060 [Lentzea sp. NPDC054927]